jgi:hypothetical protein
MDRAIARIWRGGELSSMSSGGGASGDGGVGALPQMENESSLAKTDAEQLSETCQFYLDRWVIKYRFGEGIEPKARFVLQPPQQLDSARELEIDRFLLSAGVPLAVSDLIERYGRNLPSEGDALASAPAARSFGAPFGGGGGAEEGEAGPDGKPLENVAPRSLKRFSRTAGALQAAAMAKSFAPLRAKLVEIAALEDPAQRKEQLEILRKSLPGYVRTGVSHELVKVIEDSLATAAVIGASDGAENTGHLHSRPRFQTNGTHK